MHTLTDHTVIIGGDKEGGFLFSVQTGKRGCHAWVTHKGITHTMEENHTHSRLIII